MYLPTFTGQRLNLLAPQSDEIDLLSVARGLSRAPRFAGQSREFFSVAQHSLLVEQIAATMMPVPRTEYRLAALLNRAHEAYLGPMAAPVVEALRMVAPGALLQVQGRIRGAISRRWWTPVDLAELALIDLAEREAERCEREDLRHDPDGRWPGIDGLDRPPGVPPVVALTADAAMLAFVDRFMALWTAL